VNLLKSPLRRTTAVIAGTFLGMAGVVAFAAPASAHHPVVVPVSSCVNADGTWQVSWRVTNSERDIEGDVVSWSTTARRSTITGLTVGAKLPKAGQGELLAEQTNIPAARANANLVVEAHWVRNGKDINESNSGQAPKPTEVCKPTTPPTKPPTSTEPPTTTPPTKPPASEPTTPPTTPTTPPSTPPTQAPGEPTPLLETDCDSMTIGLDNPEDGEEITLKLTTSKGEVRNLTVKPGEIKNEKFSAAPGFTITVSMEGVEETETIGYERPDGCESGSGAGDGELPLTGAAAGSIAAGAGVLLAAGGALFFMARRRKINFTA
jgi:LPXTG-motif cell wall-anchored protein